MGSLPRQRRHDLMSAVRRVTGLLDGLPADIPADPEALRRRLSLLTPAAAGITRSRWRNIRALLTAALALTGAKVLRRRRRDSLEPAWLALLLRVGDSYERARLSRFFSWASMNGIGPDDVDNRTITDFAECLKRDSLLERQPEIVRGLCLAWNRCAEEIEAWPAARLAVPNRRRDYTLPPATYPASFVADVEGYIAHLAGGDLFDATGRAPASPATLRDVRMRMFAMAAALVHSGRAPDKIRSLADLVAPDSVRTALTFLWSRNGKRKTGHIHNCALAALKIAKWWVKAPAEQIAALQTIRRQVDPQSTGMTERNRARLRQFDDPENLGRLINLPETILRSTPGSESVGYAAAHRVQLALAVGILLVAPMRMKNLAALHLGRHLSRTRPGGVRHIVIPPEEVKNRTPLSFEVADFLSELLDFYLVQCRPILSDDPNGYVFPARGGNAKRPGLLGTQIKRLIARETGINLNPHAFRHLSAMLFLAAHPGEYETVRLFLGHKSLNTTVRAYCGLEQADALRRLDALIDTHRKNSDSSYGSPTSYR
jgi:integrase